MTDLDKAYDFVNRADFEGYFAFMREKMSVTTELSTLEQTFVNNASDWALPKRMKVLALHFFDEKAVANKLLTDLRRSRVFEFVGRQEYLEKLQASLAGKMPVVLVNGTGGEGKTTLAREYAYLHQTEYDYIVWLEQISTLRSAFADNQELTADLGFRQEPIEERFNRVMQKLRNLQGNNLLVIDNYTQIEEEKSILNDLLTSGHWRHWRMLFTSREQVSDFQNAQITLEHLSETDALQLFRTHCKKTVDEQELKELLKLIDYHALTVELLAKNYEESWDFETIGEVTRLLEAKSIDDKLLQELIEISRNAHTPEQTKVYDYLLKIFAIEPLQEDEIFVLKQFAVLPPLPIVGKEFLTWIQDTERKYRATLTSLAKKGWLAYNTENKTFKMHRLVQMVLLKRLKPSFEECEMLFDSIADLLAAKDVQANPLENKKYLDYGLSLIDNIDYTENEIVKTHMQRCLSNFYYIFGNYELSLNITSDAKHIVKEALGENSEYYNDILNDIALIEYELGNYTQAKKLFREILSKYEKGILTNIQSYGRVLNDYGLTLMEVAEYEDAITLLKKALKIIKNKETANYINALTNLGLCYHETKKFHKAISIYEEEKRICVKIYSKKHLYYSTSLNNIALSYVALRVFEKAKPLYEEALQIIKEKIGTENDSYATTLDNLGDLYVQTGDYKNAKLCIGEALSIRRKVLGEFHQDCAKSYANLAGLSFRRGLYFEASFMAIKSLEVFTISVGKYHTHTIQAQDLLELIQAKLSEKQQSNP